MMTILYWRFRSRDLNPIKVVVSRPRARMVTKLSWTLRSHSPRFPFCTLKNAIKEKMMTQSDRYGFYLPCGGSRERLFILAI